MSKQLLLRGIMLLSALMLFTAAGAQQKDRLVTLSMKDKTVEEILKAIEKQISYKFMYHTNDVKSLVKKSIDLKDVKMNIAIDACLKGTNLSYQIVDDVIVLKRANTQKPTNKKRTITGVVVDDKGEPLVGAFISLVGTTTGRIADGEGRFSIVVPEEDQSALLVTFVGYDKKLVMVSDNTPVKVALSPDVMAMDEVVVTGYQNLSRKDMVATATTLKADDINVIGKTNIADMLQGQVAGMIVTNSSARAGSSPNIQIRGQSTFSSELGNQNPIWVVDGIIQDDPIEFNSMTGVVDDLKTIIGNQVSWLNPADIETITILKDASATAIYGSRASNGVIVIVTKKPKGDRLTVTYGGSVTIKSKPKYSDFNLMNSQERVNITEEMLATGMKYQYPPLKDMNTFDGVIQMYYDGDISSDTYLKRRAQLETMNTNWFDVLTRTAISNNHNISIMGRASDKFNFAASVGYTKDNGQEICNSSERFTSRISVDANLHKKLRINLSLNGTINKTSGSPSGNNSGVMGGGTPLSYATNVSRAIPAYEEDGSRASYYMRTKYKYNLDNPISFNMENDSEESTVISKGGRLSIGLNIQWDITKWLKYEFTGGYNYSDATSEIFRSERSFHVTDKYRGYDYGSALPESDFYNAALMPHGGIFDENKSNKYSYNIQNKLIFSHTFNEKHRINAMLANEIRSNLTKDFSTSVWGIIPERGNAIVAPPNKITAITGDWTGSGWGMLDDLFKRTRVYDKKDNFVSLFATLAYSFDNRYVLNANVRNDMSNRFGLETNNRFDPTYSFGLKWNITSEAFMRDRVKWLTFLNLNITYGIQGNAQLAMSPDLVMLKGGIDKYYKEFSSTISTIPNPNLSWERTTNWNYSINGRLFNAVNFSVDYYLRKSNAVISQNIGFENGVSTMQLNGGLIYNEGVEATVSFNPVTTKDFGLNVSINSSKNFNTGGPNTITSQQLSQIATYLSPKMSAIVKEGYPIGSFWSYSFNRLNDSNGSPIFNYTDLDPAVVKADPTSVLVYSGKSQPDFTGGLSLSARYKNLTFSSQFSLILGGRVRLPSPYTVFGQDFMPKSEQNISKDIINRWKKPGDEKNTIYPSLREFQDRISISGQTAINALELWANSDAMVANKGFLRCGNMDLTYNIKNEFTNKLKLSTLRVGISASNIFVIGSKRFNGFDPELGDSVMPRTYSISLNIGF